MQTLFCSVKRNPHEIDMRMVVSDCSWSTLIVFSGFQTVGRTKNKNRAQERRSAAAPCERGVSRLTLQV